MSKQEIILDVRKTEQFKKESIPEAYSIPLEELNSRLNELEQNSTITVICNHGGQRSQKAAELLKKNGYKNTEVLEGGIEKWKEEHQ